MSAGFICWAAQFTVIYAVNAVACARGLGRASVYGVELVPLAIGAATLLALAAAVAALVRARARQKRLAPDAQTEHFIAATTMLVSGLAVVAIVWHGLPALIVPVC